MVVPGISSYPRSVATTRPMLLPDSPPGRPQPSMRSLIVVGSSSGTFSSAALMISALRSSGRKSLSDPLLARPMGERAVETITASGMWSPARVGGRRAAPQGIDHPRSGLRLRVCALAHHGGHQQLEALAQELRTLPGLLAHRAEQHAVDRGEQRARPGGV